jgi:hypothetical protein
MPGSRCACAGVHAPVQLPESRDFGRTPRSEYHEEGCFRVGHDDDPVLRDLWLEVVLPERHGGALHNSELRLQRDLRIVGLWKERGFGWWLLGGLWVAAYNLLLLPTTVVKNIMVFIRAQAERALPTSTTGSVLMKTDKEVLPLQGGAGSDPDGTRTPDGDAAANSPYSSAARQLVQAREMLALQRREAAEILDNVHGYYERRMQAPPSSEQPSAPDA